MVRHTDWLLTKSGAGERRRPGSTTGTRATTAWSEGNLVRPLIHGSTYFAELYERIEATRPGDLVFFTDWQGDADEQLLGEPGTEVVEVLGRADERGCRRTRPDLALAHGDAELQRRARTGCSAASSRRAAPRRCSTCGCAPAAPTTRSWS